MATVAKCYLVLLAILGLVAMVPVAAGWHSSVVQTGSMEPLISPGDVVLASDLRADAPVPVGGVVQYRSPAAAEPGGVARIRLHRIVAANDDGTFITAGDANTSSDSSPITREQIIGQGRLLAPFVGLPSLWLRNGNATALAAWIALTAVAIAVTASWAGTPTQPRRPRHRKPSGRSPALVLRAVTTTTSIAVIAVVAGAPHEGAAAAFTATTESLRSTWTVAAPAPLTPGRATPYALLASTSITNTGAPGQTIVTGSLGTAPGSAITGFTGGIPADRSTAVARNATTDAATLYAAATSRAATAVAPSVLTGTVGPGIYRVGGALSVDGTVTLDARGEASAVFVFVADTLTARDNSAVVLTNGASAANVYWAVAGSLTVASNAIGKGTYVTRGDAAIASGARIDGRVIALGGAITLTQTVVALPR